MGYICTAIREPNHTDALGARMACGTVSDLCSHLELQVREFTEKFLESLMVSLKDPEGDTQTKYLAIVAIGDLLCHSGDKCIKQTAEIMGSFQCASQNSLTIVDDEEDQEIYTKLQESLLEA